MSTIKFEIPNVHCTNMVVVEHIGGIRYKIRYNMADHSDVYPKFKSILEEEYECTAYVFVDGGISESSDTRYIYHDMLVTNLSGETVPASECIDVGSRLAVTVDMVLRCTDVSLSVVDGVRTCTVAIGGVAMERHEHFRVVQV